MKYLHTETIIKIEYHMKCLFFGVLRLSMKILPFMTFILDIYNTSTVKSEEEKNYSQHFRILDDTFMIPHHL